MSKDMLTQEEIEALLRQNELDKQTQSSESQEIEAGTIEAGSIDDSFTLTDAISAFEQDALGEIGNISFGSAATALSTLLGQKVDITTPTVSLIKKADVDQEFPNPHVAISVQFTQGFEGVNLLVMKIQDAAIIADLMMGGDGTQPNLEMSELYLSAVQEAMNQMMGSAATSMSTIFDRRVDISPPGIDMVDFARGKGQEHLPHDDYLVKVSFRLRVGNLIDSNIMQLLPITFAKMLVDTLMQASEPSLSSTQGEAISQGAAPQSMQPPMQPSVQQPMQQSVQQVAAPMMNPSNPPINQPYMPQQMQPQVAMGYQAPMPQPQHPEQMYGQSVISNPQVQPVQFTNMDTQSSVVGQQNLNLLLDIPLQVSVELGRTKRRIQEILELTNGSIIELDKLAGEPVDILVNNKLIAKGEVVVIDENFGVRVTDIISPIDRVQKLQ